MKFIKNKLPFEHLIIDNMYTDDEMVKLKREMEYLSHKMLQPEFTEADNKSKKGEGIFTEQVFLSGMSDIVSVNRKLYSLPVLLEAEATHHSLAYISICKEDCTLINHYMDGDFYGPHTDISVLSAVTFFKFDENDYSGGDFIFTDFDYTIKTEHNRCVLFPSLVKHEVKPVKVEPGGRGRYSMAQFLLGCK